MSEAWPANLSDELAARLVGSPADGITSPESSTGLHYLTEKSPADELARMVADGEGPLTRDCRRYLLRE